MAWYNSIALVVIFLSGCLAAAAAITYGREYRLIAYIYWELMSTIMFIGAGLFIAVQL